MNAHFIELNMIGERPVGTQANADVAEYLEGAARQAGFGVSSIGFECFTWEFGASYVEAEGERTAVSPSPFSPGFRGSGEIVRVSTVEELRTAETAGKILLLDGEVSQDPLMPRDFPFYYPDEHREINCLIDEKKPAAVIAVTGRHPMCGLDPFPLFEDGNMAAPSCYIGGEAAARLRGSGAIGLVISSSKRPAMAVQPVFLKRSRKRRAGRIVLCAHMDTKYGTPGALDNASGVAVMMSAMEALAGYDGPYDLEFVPFNGEEYYGVGGQLAYLSSVGDGYGDIRLAVNIDLPCCVRSKLAVSAYNFDEAMEVRLAGTIEKTNGAVVFGEQWYAGDHSIFAFRGTPAVAVTSSNLMEKGIAVSHTPNDTAANVDAKAIRPAAEFVAGYVMSIE